MRMIHLLISLTLIYPVLYRSILIYIITLQLCQALTEGDVAKTFKTSKQHDKNAEKYEGEMGTKHTVLNEEQAAFADWINSNLEMDKDVTHKLKLNVRLEGLRWFLFKIACPRTRGLTCTRRWMMGCCCAR